MSRYPLRMTARALTTSLLAAGALLLSAAPLLLVTPAGAVPIEAPVSGDDRAVAYPGNIQAGDCAAAGLTGSVIEVEATITDSTYITITSVPAGATITGVVVKGGNAYNVYSGDVREGLHAPLNASGGPAGISHWFVCGTTTTTTDTTTTDTTTSETTSDTSTSDTTTSGGNGTTTTTDTAGASDDLASTGLSAGAPLMAAGALMLLGAALLAATRRRAFRRS